MLESNSTAAAELRLALAFVVAEYAVFQAYVSLLPAVNVVGPLEQIAREHIRLYLYLTRVYSGYRVGIGVRIRNVSAAHHIGAGMVLQMVMRAIGRVFVAAQLSIVLIGYVNTGGLECITHIERKIYLFSLFLSMKTLAC